MRIKNEFTAHEFWMEHAPDFAFEMDVDELVAEGLERGFIKCIQGDLYRYSVVLAEGEEL
jgi:hypothetical protein